MTETITRERLNEIVNQVVTEVLDALDVAPTDEEASSKSEAVAIGTKFLARTEDEKTETVDAANMQSGTLILLDYAEYFHSRLAEEGDWMSYAGEWYTDEEFAEKVRNHTALPTVVHWG